MDIKKDKMCSVQFQTKKHVRFNEQHNYFLCSKCSSFLLLFREAFGCGSDLACLSFFFLERRPSLSLSSLSFLSLFASHIPPPLFLSLPFSLSLYVANLTMTQLSWLRIWLAYLRYRSRSSESGINRSWNKQHRDGLDERKELEMNRLVRRRSKNNWSPLVFGNLVLTFYA